VKAEKNSPKEMPFAEGIFCTFLFSRIRLEWLGIFLKQLKQRNDWKIQK
jgi:hypothetical protein